MMRNGGSKFGIDLETQANNEVCLDPGPFLASSPCPYPTQEENCQTREVMMLMKWEIMVIVGQQKV